MGLATRVPGPPGVTDHKTNNVFMISDPKKPPSDHFRLDSGRIRGKSSGMGLATWVHGLPGVTDYKTNNVFMISDPKNDRVTILLVNLPPITQAKLPYQQPSASTNTIEEKEYHDEPGKPYSFGNGYIFEFSG
ncbi:hypothetical protein NQ318_021492 [Aromia moschata]|uniref:Uncharacterized protein n=1 Tax=Aromia moschata TaxID=1265417 RepID=A0AAV8ZDX9_9CUCU|nr:hypothetical protein NQ318_021492 [Aromia moschata]